MDEPPEEPHPRTSEGALTAAGLDLAALAGKGLLADLAAMPPYKSPFSESLVAGWRGSLIGASSKLQGLVAGEMAGFITRSKLPALTGFTGLAGLDTELLAKRLADQITVPLFELSTAWQKSLLAGIKGGSRPPGHLRGWRRPRAPRTPAGRVRPPAHRARRAADGAVASRHRRPNGSAGRIR